MRTARPDLCAPASTFSYALCTCDDLAQVGVLKVGRGASGDGSVGVNGHSSVADVSEVAGSWVSWKQWTGGTASHIGGSLRSGEDLVVAGLVDVDGDVAVKRNLLGAGVLHVDGDMRVGGTDIFLGVRDVHGSRRGFDGPAEPPCGCEGSRLFDVVGAVNAARTMNDNATQGLPEGGIFDIGIQKVSLSTGRYYFKGIHNIGLGALTIKGNVSVYVDGSLDEIGAEAIKLEPGATLDLYVSGPVRLVGFSPFGDPQSPSSFRLFVGSSERLTVSAGLQLFFGSIYAPTADIVMAGVTVVWGSLFARNVIDAGVLSIKHGGAIPACTPPRIPPTTSTGGTTGGTSVPPPPPPTTPPTPAPVPPAF